MKAGFRQAAYDGDSEAVTDFLAAVRRQRDGAQRRPMQIRRAPETTVARFPWLD